MIRVVHYVNQFFAGIGGEEKADSPFEMREGAVGPGRALEMIFGDEAEIVQTLVCGDNEFHADPNANLAAIMAAISDTAPDLVLAGPAFNAGRYGLACAAVCVAVSEEFGIPAVTGVFPEAPAVDVYGTRVVMVGTGNSAAGMKPALDRLAAVGLRLASGEGLLPVEEDGRIPMGYRSNTVTETPVATRALDMLMAKLNGEPHTSEIDLPEQAEPVPPAPAIPDLSQATVVLITEGGLVPEDNPDRIESSSATKWARYPLSMLEENEDPAFKSIHAGYDSRWVDADPNRLVPLDAARSLVEDGTLGTLYEYFYVTTGNGTTVSHAERMGGEIAKQLIEDGVQAAILTST
jgi:betaine reductase